MAEAASVTPSYVGRLEAGGAAPGIDLVERLAGALGEGVAGLLPSSEPPDDLEVPRRQARALCDAVLEKADRDALVMLNPLLARIAESHSKAR
ncbi:MAG: helix-turn-helix transcriptional regulator [Gemmataceae bacterium]|nr:helix-turn-helix transcriptional regulator [Gemmataceae bacterium]